MSLFIFAPPNMGVYTRISCVGAPMSRGAERRREQRLGLRWVSPDIGQYQLLGNSSDYSAIANSPFGTVSVIKTAVALHISGTGSQAIRSPAIGPGLEKRKRVCHGS